MNEDKVTKILLSLEEFRKEANERFGSIDNRLEEMDEKLDELKSSSNALDKILEQHPIERVERLETHNHLPVFTPVDLEE